MGYSTEYNGSLDFTKPLSEVEKTYLIGVLYKDNSTQYFSRPAYSLELTRLQDGLQWDGSEKSHIEADQINTLIREMRKLFPDFGLTGELLAQGEDPGDISKIRINKDGWAEEVIPKIVWE
jgi:hypothetical protein